jgi:hypothetical protein
MFVQEVVNNLPLPVYITKFDYRTSNAHPLLRPRPRLTVEAWAKKEAVQSGCEESFALESKNYKQNG